MSKSSLSIGRIYRVYLDRQGYDDCGRYYGVGAPVYSCWYGNRTYEVRADNLAHARSQLRLTVYAGGHAG